MASAQQVVVHDDDEATSPRQVVPAGTIAGSADAGSADAAAADTAAPATADADAAKPASWPVVVATSAVMGLVFGLAFSKSRVFEPANIRAQFLFERFVMLKMFMGAMGTGAVCLSFLARRDPAAFARARALWKGSMAPNGLLTSAALGGVLLGVGMAIAGACPGMVLAQIGAGVPKSGLTLAGGVAGALVFGLAQPWLKPRLLSRGVRSERYALLDDHPKMARFSYPNVALGMGVACLGFAVVLEILFPWKEDLDGGALLFPVRYNPPGCNWFTECRAWVPTIGGVLIGALQVPALLCLNTFLGSATSYQIVAACACAPHVTLGKGTEKSFLDYMKLFASPNPLAWWQLSFVCFAILGALGMEELVDDYGLTPGVPDVASALAGGFLMLLGSRLGAGCTSGHGITGCVILLLNSWVAVPCMFGGGIAYAVVAQYGATDKTWFA